MSSQLSPSIGLLCLVAGSAIGLLKVSRGRLVSSDRLDVTRPDCLLFLRPAPKYSASGDLGSSSDRFEQRAGFTGVVSGTGGRGRGWEAERTSVSVLIGPRATFAAAASCDGWARRGALAKMACIEVLHSLHLQNLIFSLPAS